MPGGGKDEKLFANDIGLRAVLKVLPPGTASCAYKCNRKVGSRQLVESVNSSSSSPETRSMRAPPSFFFSGHSRLQWPTRVLCRPLPCRGARRLRPLKSHLVPMRR